MKIAITGGTGFVGGYVARELTALGHEVVLVARGVDRRDLAIRHLPGARFVAAGLGDVASLAEAFAGCHGVAHCAGVNRERGAETFRKVHVDGTRIVVEAARRAGVRKVLLLSFLRARPGCGSAYHETKFEAEEIVRDSGLDYTVLKAGVIYGRGDHMLDHLCHGLHTFPFFPLVGVRTRRFRPMAAEDVARLIRASLVNGKLGRKTVWAVGPEEMPLREGIARVARAIGRRPVIFPCPVFLHRILAYCFEKLMVMPLVARAQVRMLAEGMVEPSQPCEDLPADLRPSTRFTQEQITKGLPEPGGFGLRELRCCARAGT